MLQCELTPDNSFLHTFGKHYAFLRTQKSKGALEDLTQFSLKEYIYIASLLSLLSVGQGHGWARYAFAGNVILMGKAGMPRFQCLFWDRGMQKKKGFQSLVSRRFLNQLHTRISTTHLIL